MGEAAQKRLLSFLKAIAFFFGMVDYILAIDHFMRTGAF